jgi:hypothetical protein
MESVFLDIQKVQEHLENLEKEIGILKKLIESSLETRNERRIHELRKKLLNDGLDEEIVMLVGTIPLYNENYKDDIRTVICERYKRKYE